MTQTKTVHVLAVDDDEASLKLADSVLSAAGFSVTSVTNSRDAIMALSASTPDAILLDMRLRSSSGTAVANEIRTSGIGGNVAILAVTAYPAIYAEEESRRAGCDGFIQKPVDVRLLPTQVLDAIRDRRKAHIAPETLLPGGIPPEINCSRSKS